MPTRKSDVVDENTGEVTGDIELYQEPLLSNAELNSIETTKESVLAQLEAWGLPADDLIIGDVYRFVEDKDELIGVPFVMLQWKFGDSPATGAEYVQIRAVRTDTNEKIGIFDSGVGIRRQLSDLTESRLKAHKPAYNGAIAHKGLTASEYGPKHDEAGNLIRPGGKTYYIA